MDDLQIHSDPTREKQQGEVETLTEWALRRFEEITQIANSRAAAQVLRPPISTMRQEEDHQLAQQTRISPEPGLEQNLYDTYIKLRNLMEQYGNSRREDVEPEG